MSIGGVNRESHPRVRKQRRDHESDVFRSWRNALSRHIAPLPALAKGGREEGHWGPTSTQQPGACEPPSSRQRELHQDHVGASERIPLCTSPQAPPDLIELGNTQ
jgi:hypothetical protein